MIFAPPPPYHGVGLLVLSALYRFDGAFQSGVTGPKPFDEEILVHVSTSSGKEDGESKFLDQGVLREALEAV